MLVEKSGHMEPDRVSLWQGTSHDLFGDSGENSNLKISVSHFTKQHM